MTLNIIIFLIREEIRKEIRDLKKSYRTDKHKKVEEAKIEESRLTKEDSTIKEYKNEVALYKAKKKELPKKGKKILLFAVKPKQCHYNLASLWNKYYKFVFILSSKQKRNTCVYIFFLYRLQGSRIFLV